jgi:hypothetical protein
MQPTPYIIPEPNGRVPVLDSAFDSAAILKLILNPTHCLILPKIDLLLNLAGLRRKRNLLLTTILKKYVLRLLVDKLTTCVKSITEK